MKKDFFNPVKLIIKSIKDKLEGQNVDRIILVFSFIDERYSISIKPLDNSKPLMFEVEPKDVSLIKKIFVNKIYRSIDQAKYKALILQLDLPNEKIDLFLQNNNNEVLKYDYDLFKK